MKVLFVYPNHKGMNMLPPAIGLLSACLKEQDHTVKLFDTTYYDSVEINGVVDKTDSDASKGDRLMARPFKMPVAVEMKKTDPREDFRRLVESYQPDLLALSMTEDMYHLGIALIQSVRDLEILTVAGGVFPTFAPDLVLQTNGIDIVCRGEGEDALVELCSCLEKGSSYDNIDNLWIKKKNRETIKNAIKMVDMDKIPLLDLSIFEESRFYRPMGGEVYRMFPVETHRGCPYKCAYCNSPSQMELYRENGGQNQLRRKSFENMRRDLLFFKNEMKAEYLYFWADTFFSWNQRELEQFAEMYSEIGLPFWCQTRPETITERRMDLLGKMGCTRMSLGVEHGNESFRKKYLARRMPNSVIVDGLELLKSYQIPFSVNNIMGFPHETRELAFDTIRLNRQFSADDRNAYPFTPFSGTPLRKICESLGLIGTDDVVRSVIANGSLLDMPQFSQREVNGLVKTFNFYVKFPESRWDEIRIAEEEGQRGEKMYSELRDEYMDRFWHSSVAFEDSAAEIAPYQ